MQGMFLVYGASSASVNVAVWKAAEGKFVTTRTLPGTEAWRPVSISISVNGGPPPNPDGCLVSVGWSGGNRTRVTVTSMLTGKLYVDWTHNTTRLGLSRIFPCVLKPRLRAQPRSHCRAPLRLAPPPSHCNATTADCTVTSHCLI